MTGPSGPFAQSAEDAGLDGLHSGDCWGPTGSDCTFEREEHADCRDLVRDVLAGLHKHGYRVMRDLNINPDPNSCDYCGSEFTDSKTWCEWCDPDDSWTPEATVATDQPAPSTNDAQEG